jgi:adenine-specific DNA-methyltransferase
MPPFWEKGKKGDSIDDNDGDQRGLYFPDNFHGPDDGRENRPRYPILHPVTQQPCAMPSTGWRWEEDTTKAALAEDPPRIHFGKDHTTIPNRKSYLFEIDEEPMMSVFYKDGRAATLEVEAILGRWGVSVSEGLRGHCRPGGDGGRAR